jgi:hypothetical protein
MADWIFSRNGQATLIHDDDCFRDNRGQVIAWISGENVYSIRGQHTGWFEGGVLYDSRNQALGFLRNAKGYLPSRPGIGDTPGTPGFGGRPGRTGFSGIPGKPGRDGWSSNDLATYFNT